MPTQPKKPAKPRLAVFKFASCDGCQLSLLDLEDELLAVAGLVELAYFPEATRNMDNGPYDVALVEGSVTTPHDAKRILRVRKQSKLLIAIGACATSGGIQALRNFDDVARMAQAVYPRPDWLSTLATATPLSDHVKVDAELRGCPVGKGQLLELMAALLQGRKPVLPQEALCTECRRSQTVCVMVSEGTPCLGPVTQTGCGVLCPTHRRGCYGCFGPAPAPNTPALAQTWKSLGAGEGQLMRAFRQINAGAPAFKAQSLLHQQAKKGDQP